MAKPSSIDDQLRRGDESYYLALGRFLHMFARAETALNLQVSSFVADRIPVELEKAQQARILLRAVMGGQRISMLKDTLKRLMKVANTPNNVVSRIDAILAHLSEIHYLRDRIMHNGVLVSRIEVDGFHRCSNHAQIRDGDKLEEIFFKTSTLEKAADDLEHIPDMISAALLDDVEAQKINPYAQGCIVIQPYSFVYKSSLLVRRGRRPR